MAKKPAGRPSKYTDAVAREICERLAQGEPLASICRDERMPAVRTVGDWRERLPEFSASIARARDEGFDALAAQCLDIADDKSGDIRLVGDDDQEVCNTEFVQRAKLRIETRLKLLAKWDPKRYGDRVDHSSSDGSMSQKPTVIQFVSPPSDDDSDD